MIRGNRKFTTANIAIATALLCGAPVAFAQDTAAPPQVVAPPPVVQSAPASAPAPASVTTPTVAPPPVVPTVAVEPVQAEQAVPRRTSNRATARPASRARATPVADIPEPASNTPANEPTVINAPVLDETAGIVAPVDEAIADIPVEQSNATPIADGTDDDWMIYGGLAAALGLAGLGGVIASRRRKTRSRDSVALEPSRVAPAPARAMTAPLVSNPTPASTLAPFIAPVAAPIRRPSFADQHLPRVTDPLFKHQAELAPVTDPLFMHKTELAPVTDPMFADKDEYAGRSSDGAAFDKRCDLSGQSEERKPLHEFEPVK